MNNLKDFQKGFIYCAIWLMEATENYNPIAKDISKETIKTIKGDCKKFIQENLDILEKIPSTWEQDGHDFFLSRNGQGAGFFDRGYGEDGDILQESARKFGSLDFYIGDDGKIYCF